MFVYLTDCLGYNKCVRRVSLGLGSEAQNHADQIITEAFSDLLSTAESGVWIIYTTTATDFVYRANECCQNLLTCSYMCNIGNIRPLITGKTTHDRR